MPGHRDIDDGYRFGRHLQPHRRELLGASHLTGLDQHAAASTDLAVEMTRERHRALLPQPRGTLLDHLACDLWHAGGGRPGPRREWKDMQVCEPALIDEIERARKHR